MKPTVGRVVYYKSYGTPGGEYGSEDRAAIITAVEDEEKGIVSLCVLNPTGMFFNQGVTQGDRGGQWDWMPYQKGQAQKTEQVISAKINITEEEIEQMVYKIVNKINEDIRRHGTWRL